MRTIDLINQTFGRLTVISRASNDVHRHVRWFCRCICGTETVVYTQSLRSGCTKSCGCLAREVRRIAITTHGQACRGKRSPEYATWVDMWKRCTNLNRVGWMDYGGRGIHVCPEWRDFTAFLKHVGPRPAPWMSLDRINNDGNYEPGNVRWATKKMQANNRRPQKRWESQIESYK